MPKMNANDATKTRVASYKPIIIIMLPPNLLRPLTWYALVGERDFA